MGVRLSAEWPGLRRHSNSDTGRGMNFDPSPQAWRAEESWVLDRRRAAQGGGTNGQGEATQQGARPPRELGWNEAAGQKRRSGSVCPVLRMRVDSGSGPAVAWAHLTRLATTLPPRRDQACCARSPSLRVCGPAEAGPRGAAALSGGQSTEEQREPRGRCLRRNFPLLSVAVGRSPEISRNRWGSR